MNSLRFASKPGQQTTLAVACIAVGTVLAYGFRHFSGPGISNSLAGFLLGVLLLVIGIWAFAVRGKQAVFIDTHADRIVIEDTNHFGAKRRVIPFGDIADTGIGYLGRKSNYVTFYYIVLHLKNGEQYPLFAPGRFYDGGSDRCVMETRRQQLDELLRQSSAKRRTG